MIERQLWHPVALAEEVAAAPMAVRLLGENLVLWRDGAAAVHAWADRCPHRGARLSLGRVVACDGAATLECPYHGWRFEAGGRCVQVPALPDFVPPATHRAATHAALEAQGLVWVRLDAEGGDAPLPAFAAEDDARMRKISCGPYDVETSAPRLVENFLDMAHFGFVHEGWLGAREMAVIDDYRVEATPGGLRATGCKAWQPQSTVNSTAPAQVEYSYEVTAPYAAVLTKVPEAASIGLDGYRESIALQICPVDAERCRVWFRFATSDFERDEATVRAFQDTIFLQDKPVLESQSPKRLPLDLRAELHTVADKASSLYRRHLKMRGITFGVC
ncbi:aromatic ring-hydroxylating oxygenase subunit alpha [Variovorax saccharolyticus]|uniref:aromatic ring-hydroxylating oxygenase subunit alpha n=1 Tax=Variovorax saccharolyticus TaxID=3053516 RepID=UPI002574E372|nr:MULTISPECIES: aromatic ring-hydroxylating dioxygenase subunit alpha [unclassified Variovorax]MDM0021378.1 aromatic ring-hydroxylating dioxygenase subunit alpha [Variovorax sp. J22R187]MDM0027387.1 aromatic ring-hydroxylating dioxygenase subunit alpha [Variovorax sp. J31P216]